MRTGEKIVGKKTGDKRTTWTFQPDSHVAEAVIRLNGGKKLSRGQRTELIKKALAYQYPEAFVAIAKKRLADAAEEVAELERRLVAGSDVPNSGEEKEMRELAADEEAGLANRDKKR